ncbi:hypothetical protein [Mycobacteroides abscessus]|uniref:hypothetical protein n=1 Tax=Mycobacteroides abscessus TaxID=36809 RepID=UPI0010564414|nr:hypothetical protein [Mycobacteroides abscessus]
MRTETEAPALDWMWYAIAWSVGTTTTTHTYVAVVASALGQVSHQTLSQTADPAEAYAGGAIDAHVGVGVDRSAGDHTAPSVARAAGVGTWGMASCVAHLGARAEVAGDTRNRVLRRVRHRAAATTYVHAYASVA